jgi:hypothetical protein
MKQCTCYALRAIDCTCKPAKYGELYTTPKQEQGEPVGFYDARGNDICIEIPIGESADWWQPVYTTPQQRTWVHLTNQEHDEIAIECGCMSADWVFYGAAVERKVREKNT